MEPTKKKTKHECENCKQTFNRAERLENHSKKGCNRTTCNRCSKKFRTNHDLQCHQENTDLKDCEICEKKYCNVHDYEFHKQNIHHIIRMSCNTCSRKFSSNRDLQSHQKNADPKVCDSCDKIFCHESELARHKRTKHVGGEIRVDVDVETALDRPICPRTGFEEDEGYKEKVKEHWSEIRDKRKESSYLMDINKELSPDFTYRDLEKLLKGICKKLGHAVKVNIGFGFMLRDGVTGEYKYFYVLTTLGNLHLLDGLVLFC